MKLIVKTINGSFETTTRHEVDQLLETPDDLPRMFASLVDHLLNKGIILPEELTNVFNTYRTYTHAPL